MSIIKTSEASLAEDAKDKIPLLALAKLWIPLIIVIVGFLLLVVGSWLLLRARKAPAAASPAQG